MPRRTASSLPQPKVIASTVASLLAPLVASLLGVDESPVLAVLSAVAALIVGYVAPAASTVPEIDPADVPEFDDETPSDVLLGVKARERIDQVNQPS